MSMSASFNSKAVSGQSKPSTRPKSVKRPFTVRFTDDEREYLEAKAGRKPLATFIRDFVLEGKSAPRRSSRKPKVDEQQLALVLAQLGESRLSSNVNQLAKHANMGTLDIGAETEQELLYAAQAIVEMRKALFIALGLKP